MITNLFRFSLDSLAAIAVKCVRGMGLHDDVSKSELRQSYQRHMIQEESVGSRKEAASLAAPDYQKSGLITK